MASPAFDPALPYEIHPQVAIRPEPFGGLAYNYENRRLTLITAQPLVEIVNSLDAHATADDAIAATVEAPERDRYSAALGTLHDSGVIRVR